MTLRTGDVLRNTATGHEYRIVHSAADTGGALLEMEAVFPARAPAPPLHMHPAQEEHFEVLDGALEVDVGGRRSRLVAGQTLIVPSGTPHAMWNADDVAARVRWQTRPALRTAEFFETLVALAASGRVSASGTPRMPELALLLETFAPEMRVVSPPPVVQRIVFRTMSTVARVLGRQLPSLRGG